jgi:hypothetical protein
MAAQMPTAEPTDPAGAAPPISRMWLTTRVFAFRAGPQLQLLCPALRFEQDGQIGGHEHPNEAGWRIEHGKLVVLGADGIPTCIASPNRNDDQTVSLIGVYLLDAAACVHRFDEIGGVDQRPERQAFDLFDTLITRRCVEPTAIFQLVETKSGVADFSRLRRAAERDLWTQGEYTLDDIYAALARVTDWNAQTLTTLRMLELAEEWDNLFPVQEFAARVGPNDMIVSDRYLPIDFLRSVVDQKCGLEGRAIQLSSRSEHDGSVQPRIQSTHRIRRHDGDGQGRDVGGAERKGMTAEYVTITGWTRGEQILLDAGLDRFAELVREARLRSFDPTPSLRRAQLAQFDVNFPLLLVASLDVLRRAYERGHDTLLMCSRDCNLWVAMMRWVVAHSPTSPLVRYFHASRDLLLADSLEFAAYFLRSHGQSTLIVDVSGTGCSLAHFIAHIGAQGHTSVFLAAFSAEISQEMRHLAPVRDQVDIESLTEQPYERRIAIEQLNMSVEGRTSGIEFTGREFQVLRDPNEFGPPAQVVLAVMRRAFFAALASLQRSATVQLPDGVTSETLRIAAQALFELLDDYADVTSQIQ